MKKYLMIFIFFSILFSSCVSISYERVKQLNLNQSRKEGMIVGSISLENVKKIAGRHAFIFNKAELPNELNVRIHDSLKNKENYSDYYSNINLTPSNFDFEENEKRIYLFNIIKPAGKYKFYEIVIYINTGTMQSTHTLPVQIPFEVEEGKIKYLGEINFKVKKAEVQLLDNIERDRIMFKKKYPNIVF